MDEFTSLCFLVSIDSSSRLYTELDDEQQAAAAYKILVKETEGTPFSKDYADAYRYLAYHHLKLNQFHLAFQFAQLCLNFEEVILSSYADTKFVGIIFVLMYLTGIFSSLYRPKKKEKLY